VDGLRRAGRVIGATLVSMSAAGTAAPGWCVVGVETWLPEPPFGLAGFIAGHRRLYIGCLAASALVGVLCYEGCYRGGARRRPAEERLPLRNAVLVVGLLLAFYWGAVLIGGLLTATDESR